MLVVGLTGGIGCGKSEVSRLFTEKGTPVIDTDQIAREILVPGSSALSFIVSAMGQKILQVDGNLDRNILRDLIFSDLGARKKLEITLHPLILEKTVHRLDAERNAERKQAKYIILVVPLLVESPSFLNLTDRVLLVDCPESIQIERVVKRSQLDPAQVRAIITAQASKQDRMRIANDFIDNTGSLLDLEKQVSRLHLKYLYYGEKQG